MSNDQSYPNSQQYPQPPEGNQPPYQQQYDAGQPGYYQEPGYQQPGYQYPAPYQEVPYYPNQKSKLAAGLFGIFLGAFGVHNFYLGFTGKAVAQLLITILSLGMLSFVSAIWGLIEGILILASQPGSQWSFDAQGIPLRQ